MRIVKTGNHDFSDVLRGTLLLASLPVFIAGAAEQGSRPKPDVVEVPAMGQSPWVANVFQSTLVLERGKPLNIRGWADPGEKVIVRIKTKNRVPLGHRLEPQHQP